MFVVYSGKLIISSFYNVVKKDSVLMKVTVKGI